MTDTARVEIERVAGMVIVHRHGDAESDAVARAALARTLVDLATKEAKA